MSKDQALGAAICVLCVIVTAGYIGVVGAPQLVKNVLPWLPWSASELQFGAVATVVLLAFLAIMFIGAWIGWTMATTPPPKPLEEITLEQTEKEGQTKEKE